LNHSAVYIVKLTTLDIDVYVTGTTELVAQSRMICVCAAVPFAIDVRCVPLLQTESSWLNLSNVDLPTPSVVAMVIPSAINVFRYSLPAEQ